MPASQFQRECADILAKWIGYRNIEENIRPEWMMSDDGTRLELDLFVEVKGVAFEIQGEQHYRFTPRFHKDYEDFERQRNRDEQKHWLCECENVRLFIINSVEEMKWTVSGLRNETRKLRRAFKDAPTKTAWMPQVQMKKKHRDKLQEIYAELSANCTLGRRQYLEGFARGIEDRFQKRVAQLSARNNRLG